MRKTELFLESVPSYSFPKRSAGRLADKSDIPRVAFGPGVGSGPPLKADSEKRVGYAAQSSRNASVAAAAFSAEMVR